MSVLSAVKRWNFGGNSHLETVHANTSVDCECVRRTKSI